MSLREAGLDLHQFQVDAADISEVALQKARGGKYGLRSVRVVAPAIQDRYFHVTSEGVEVRPEIRQAVRFMQANIVEAQVVLHGNTYDAVFCRNLVIYLTPTARRQILHDVNRRLSPEGLFFVGHAEMLSEFEVLFEPVHERGAFAYSRRSAPKAVQLATPVAVTASARSNDIGAAPIALLSATPSNKGRYVQVIPSEAPSNPSSTKNSIELLHVGPSAPSRELKRDELLQKVSDLSNASRHSEAIEACKQRLLQEGPSPQGYYLLGMVLQAAGLHEEAAQALERVIYLDPQHDEALLALSLLARRRGDVEVAKRFEQRSQRAHDRRVRP
jgi:chemotaxis protein methyltransferase WspC